MTSVLTYCEGSFIGHAIASKYDPTIYMALNVSNSLIECKKFNGPDILSRHLYLYHTKKCEIGGVIKHIYQQALERLQGKRSLTREDFYFDQNIIDELVQLADKNANGQTGGCNPAQRSYPLAFCSFISDDDLFDYTVLESKLTHYNPVAGQVAGIVNVICRSLLRKHNWHAAINSAFTLPNLHDDIKLIYGRHHRFSSLGNDTSPAYAPNVLNAALHYVTNSKNAAEAIAKANEKDKHYCTTLVGILAGACWGIPVEMFRENINDAELKTLREAASKLSDLWVIKPDNASA